MLLQGSFAASESFSQFLAKRTAYPTHASSATKRSSHAITRAVGTIATASSLAVALYPVDTWAFIRLLPWFSKESGCASDPEPADRKQGQNRRGRRPANA